MMICDGFCEGLCVFSPDNVHIKLFSNTHLRIELKLSELFKVVREK